MLKTVRPFRLLVALAMMLALFATPVTASSSQTAREIESAKATRDRYNQRLAEARANQNALQNQTNQLSSDLAWIQSRNEEQRELCELLLQQKNDALMVMAQTANDYADAVEALEEKKGQYAARLRIMFDYTGQSMFDAFLEADSLQGFFTTVEFMKLISDSDEQMIEELTAAREECDLRKADAEAAATEMERLVEEADAALAELQSNEMMANSRMYDLKNELSAANNEAAAWAAESAAINNEIANLTAQYNSQIEAERRAEAARQEAARQEAARQEAARREAARLEAERQASQTQTKPAQPATPPAAPPPSSGGGYAWPVPGHYRVSSYFGYRNLFGGTYHSGIDVPAPSGTPIVAAKSGVVLLTGFRGNYGRLITIAHSDGTQTYYAHCSGFAVSPGQTVSRGQTIGYVGNTGRSTGPHLHFEIRNAKGTAVNPMSYY
ncbi:MAG TPA: peptidoglycan DD-metalloendopeptidase family protein [Fastidiosipila sp.]|nr:peptidoglycan DD-metalloendopeptidase family protein [Fastidiosipila sp.]